MTYTLKDAGTRKREVEGILDALKEFKLAKGIILTYDESDSINTAGKKIDVMPVWQWLLR